MLTAQRLEEMRSVDIGAVTADTLANVSGLCFDNTLSRKERLARFHYETKCPKAVASLMYRPDRGIIQV